MLPSRVPIRAHSWRMIMDSQQPLGAGKKEKNVDGRGRRLLEHFFSVLEQQGYMAHSVSNTGIEWTGGHLMTSVSLPNVKPQSYHWGFSDLHQWNHWQKFKEPAVGLLGMEGVRIMAVVSSTNLIPPGPDPPQFHLPIPCYTTSQSSPYPSPVPLGAELTCSLLDHPPVLCNPYLHHFLLAWRCKCALQHI